MLKLRKKGVPALGQADSVIAEQYRAIRTNIQFSSQDKRVHTLAVTSPETSEGKSTTVANLAVSMSQQGQKVLLIDADLRNPTVHSIFGTENTAGLVDVLQGTMSWREAAQKTEFKSLDVLSSGLVASSPADWLDSKVMEGWLQEAKEEYDLVLFDCSSVLDFVDARMIAHLCDGVVLVLRSGKTKLENAVEANRILEFSKARVIGVILNGKE